MYISICNIKGEEKRGNNISKKMAEGHVTPPNSIACNDQSAQTPSNINAKVLLKAKIN